MKYIVLFLLILSFSSAFADPHYWPTTTIVEDFAAIWCVTCLDAIAGIDVIEQQHHNGEMFSVRYYTTSGELSNPEIDARFEHYQVYGVPSVFFNGKFRVDGGGVDIANGETYSEKLGNFINHGSPLKMQITGWQPGVGRLTGTVTKLNANQVVDGEHLRFILMEDNVETNATYVVRSIITQPISLPETNSEVAFEATFTINPSWNVDNLWAAAFVQMENDTILQAVHTKPLPEYNFRAAMDWNPQIVGPANYTYLSQPMYFYNLGASDDYQMRIVVDSAPDDWYFNYCDEDGGCFPGSVQLPLSLNAGEIKPYHLNLMIGSSGTGYFHWEFTSANLGTYIVPFRYRTDDVSADDPTLLPQALVLGKNYPNPFHNTTTIPVFAQKDNSSINLQIFNIKGQLVKEIVRDGLSSGTNSIVFDSGAELSSGIYYYRLKGAENTPARKMLISR